MQSVAPLARSVGLWSRSRGVMLPPMTDRVRKELRTLQLACAACGRAELRLVRSREVRQGLSRLNPFWDGKPSTYAICHACGARLPA